MALINRHSSGLFIVTMLFSWLIIPCISALATSDFPAECFGTGKNSNGLIYLHGIDTLTPGTQELENRELMQALASELNMDLAVVRSDQPCQDKNYQGKLCWMRKPEDVLSRTVEKIERSGSKCFRSDAKVGLVGFSNAGYLLLQAAADCATLKAQWSIAIGAGGSADFGRVKGACGRLRMMLGNRDVYSEKSARMGFSRLKSLGRDVELVPYDGKHELQKVSLTELIKKQIAPDSAIEPSQSVAAWATGAVEKNCDLNGKDLAAKNLPDQQSCQDYCDQEQGCRGYVFISGWGKCFLKSKVVRQSSVKMISGKKDLDRRLGPIEIFDDHDNSGKDMRRVTNVKDGASCAQECQNDAACKGFTLIGGYGDCWLKSTSGKIYSKVFYCRRKDK